MAKNKKTKRDQFLRQKKQLQKPNIVNSRLNNTNLEQHEPHQNSGGDHSKTTFNSK